MELDDARQQPRYRLAHDLFVPAVISLSKEFRINRQRRRQRLRIAGLTSLLVVAVASLFALFKVNGSLNESRNLDKGKSLLAEAELIKEKLPQTSLLLTLEALNYLPADMQTITSGAGRNLLEGLYNIGGVSFPGYTGSLKGLSHSSSGKWVLGWTDHENILWKIEDGEPQEVVRLDMKIESAVFSPDDQWLVIADTNSVKAWPLEDMGIGKNPLVLPDARKDSDFIDWKIDDLKFTMAFNNSGTRLIAGGWLLASGKNRFIPLLKIGPGKVSVFSPDDKKLAVANGEFRYVVAFDSVNHVSADTLESYDVFPDMDLKFSHNSKWIVATGDEYGVHVWNIAKNSDRRPVRIPEDSSSSSFTDFSADDKYLVVANRDSDSGNIKLFELATLRGVPNMINLKYDSDLYNLYQKRVCSPHNQLIAISGNTLFVWDLNRPREAAREISCKYHLDGIEFGDKDQLLTPTLEGPILEWDLSNPEMNEPMGEMPGNEIYTNYIYACESNSYIIAGYIVDEYPHDPGLIPAADIGRPSLRIWKQWENYRAIPKESYIRDLRNTQFDPSAISPNGKWLFTGGQLFSLDSGGVLTKKRVLDPRPANFTPTALNDHWMAEVRNFRFQKTADTVLLWDLDRAKDSFLLRHNFSVRNIRFSRTGNWLIVYSASRVQLWDLRGPAPAMPVPVHLGENLSVISFSDDDRYLCAGFSDGGICVYDVSGEKPIVLVQGGESHKKGITYAGYYPSRKGFYMGSYDGCVDFWSPKGNGRELSFNLRNVDKALDRHDSVAFLEGGNDRWLFYKRSTMYISAGPLFCYDLGQRPDSAVQIIQRPYDKVSISNHWVVSKKESEKTISLWDLSEQDISPGQKDIYDPEYENSYALQLLISPDGRLLATAYRNKLGIRDIYRSDQPRLLSIETDTDVILKGISADGRWLITGGFRKLCAWPLDFEYLKKEALRVVGRTLTPQERRVYDIPQLSPHSR